MIIIIRNWLPRALRHSITSFSQWQCIHQTSVQPLDNLWHDICSRFLDFFVWNVTRHRRYSYSSGYNLIQMKLFFFNSKIVLSVPLHVTETRSSTQYAHSCVERIRGVLEEGLCSSLCLGSVVSNTDFWQEQRYSHVGLLLYSVTHCFITTCFTCFLNITPQHWNQDLRQNKSNAQSVWCEMVY